MYLKFSTLSLCLAKTSPLGVPSAAVQCPPSFKAAVIQTPPGVILCPKKIIHLKPIYIALKSENGCTCLLQPQIN
jgi:hypothetical protein